MNLLALKAVKYNDEKFISPSWSRFVWPRDAIVEATCVYNKRLEGTELEHTVPCPIKKDDKYICNCGLYGVNTMEIIKYYAGEPSAVVMLMNTYGRVHVQNMGLRAQAMKPIAIVDTCIDGIGMSKANKMGERQAAIMAASRYFYMRDGKQMDVLPIGTIFHLLQLTWNVYANIKLPDHPEIPEEKIRRYKDIWSKRTALNRGNEAVVIESLTSPT